MGRPGEKKKKGKNDENIVFIHEILQKKTPFILKRIQVETQFRKATLVFLASDDYIRGVSTRNDTRGFLETSSLSCLGYGSNRTHISQNLSNIFSVCILYSNYITSFKKHQKYGRLNKSGAITE